jgi:4-diphosphocytidyl-2-C-methyl-D-erythritol kinase
MCTIGLFDTLTIEPDGTNVSLTCDDPSLKCDSSNLIVRAARALQEEVERHHAGSERTRDGPDLPCATRSGPSRIRSGPGVKVHLTKRIPVGGGLGGGSSDAAHMILALNRLWNLYWPTARLAPLAATLGSDVPFFLHGPSSLCTGRGEIVEPIPAPKARWAVIVMPGFALPTPDVYRKFDELGLGAAQAVNIRPPLQNWTQLSARELLKELSNDLEPAAFAICPQLSDLRRDIEQTLGRPVRMSGSGSSLFSLFDDSSEANSAAARIHDRHAVKTAAVEIAPAVADDLNVV